MAGFAEALREIPSLGSEACLITGAVRRAQSGPRGSLSRPRLSPATKAHNQQSILKNTQDTDPSWVLLKCQEQAHDKVVKEWRKVVQAVRWQGGADPLSMALTSPLCQGLSGHYHHHPQQNGMLRPAGPPSPGL